MQQLLWRSVSPFFHHCVKSVQIRSLFWFVFSCIQSRYRKIWTRKNSALGHFSCSACESKKSCNITWSVWVFFTFLEKRRPNEYCSKEINTLFCMETLILMCNIFLFRKIAVYNVVYVFVYFSRVVINGPIYDNFIWSQAKLKLSFL